MDNAALDVTMTQEHAQVDGLTKDGGEHLHEPGDDRHAIVREMLRVVVGIVHELESFSNVRRQIQMESDAADEAGEVDDEPVISLPCILEVYDLERHEEQQAVLHNEHQE